MAVAKKAQPAARPEPQSEPEAVIEFGTAELVEPAAPASNGCVADRERYGMCVGTAVMGTRVCSRHAVWYRADGTERG